MAIIQQQLDMKNLRSNPLTGSQMKRPLIVTPNVAATTAAALNAERSAQKLKTRTVSHEKLAAFKQ